MLQNDNKKTDNLLGEGHEEVWDTLEGLSGLVGLADKPLNAAGVRLGLIDDPVVDGADDAGLSPVAEVGVEEASLFVFHHGGLGLCLFRDLSDDLEGLDLLGRAGEGVVVVAADDGVDAAERLLWLRELSSTIPEREKEIIFKQLCGRRTLICKLKIVTFSRMFVFLSKGKLMRSKMSVTVNKL